MTRIISGFAGSLRLTVPTSGTRPTSDRVREAIFSALEARDALRGAQVLDLFAGSGALGLEAASRGARRVVLVDKSPAATRVMRANAATITRAAPRGESPEITVSSQSVTAYLVGAAGSFDLVFIDPPYELDNAALRHDLELLAPRLAPDATVVVERSTRDPEPEWPDGFELERQKTYGETTLYWVAATSP
tara:strand:- start:10487 stop:11059 length:573 start_codon:yes stop_codon:yes gene_type:complete